MPTAGRTGTMAPEKMLACSSRAATFRGPCERTRRWYPVNESTWVLPCGVTVGR
ncbi:hypothetical protein NFA_55990 [Nocardia farcinica IFM 10152]|uniref:Uncharacterized protein n=1 Tax=Nocardia farcinica (strain IFM 10152) TaxID=247156 RepID=Q5YMZ0_NOCFA|nr:hypothetical protein NFA_55990 [Nocardia farcinica IFM 10152]